ncbi:MAG: 4a-hydroxytetrahydrobiopterin dehydratase [Alphaproteobacteria bacterium]
MVHFKEHDNALVGEFKFKDFAEAFAFLTRVAIISEKLNHHAQIENMYNRVTLTLTTHDAGNTVTDKDHNFAESVENILKRNVV